MAFATLAVPGPLSVITLAERDVASPAWRAMFDWPETGHAHVAFDAKTPHQRNLSATHLDDAVASAERPVLLVAQGASCFAAAWWARLSPSSYVSRVAGALFFNPFDDDGAAIADTLRKFNSPRSALPFPSILLDGGPATERLRAVAGDWGSRLADARDLGQMRTAKAGPWRHAQRMIERYTANVVKRDIRTARERLR